MQGFFGVIVSPPLLLLSPPPGAIFYVENVNDVGFIFPLLKYIYRFPHLDFGFFRFWIFQKISDCLFMFSLRLRKKQIISCEWLLFKWEPVNVNLAKASVQEFSGLVLHNFKEVVSYLFWWTVKVFPKVEPFFQILKVEFGFSRFSSFLVSFSI